MTPEEDNKQLIERIEAIQNEIKTLKDDLVTQGLGINSLKSATFNALYGIHGDEESRSKSAMGRLQKVIDELDKLKAAQAEMKTEREKDDQRRERYITGAILAALASTATWVVSRVLGGN